LIGAWLASPDRAYAWADSEVYSHGWFPDNHVEKLVVNKDIRAAVVTCGDTWLLELAKEATEHASSFDNLAERLLPRLAAREWTPHKLNPQDGGFLAVGYSRLYSEICGYQIRYKEGFVPRKISLGLAWPHVREMHNVRAASDIAAVARAQMGEIEKDLPRAGGGRVTLAEISVGSIAQRIIVDFDREARVRRTVELERMSLAMRRA
jgi:hypothetical protein